MLFVVLFLSIAISEGFARPTLKKLLKNSGIEKDVNFLWKQFASLQKFNSKMGPNDMTFECALCGIALNEVEGFMSENRTVAEIEALLEQRFCDKLGPTGKFLCDLLVGELGYIISLITGPNSVSTICVSHLHLCSRPFDHPDDMVKVPKVILNLDLAPKDRWTDICAMPSVKNNGQFLYNFITSILPGHGKLLNDLGEMINDIYFPTEYRDEVIGCAAAMGVPYGWVALFQLGYELSDACTSIIMKASNGNVYHARNLDFGAGMGFSNTLKNSTFQIVYQKGKKTVFTATTFGGYLGVLSGMKKGVFSGTVDTRFYPEGISQLFYEIIAAIEEKNASLVSFLLRDTLTTATSYQDAITQLSSHYLISDVYYIVGGVSTGAVISRNRTIAADVWSLNPAAGRWFEVQTNYDHWNQPPWFDNRRDPAIAHVKALGQNNINSNNLFTKILGAKPTLNLQTTYSIVAIPATGFYETFVRWCNYPCVQ